MGELTDRELDEAASRLVESHGATSMDEAREIIRVEGLTTPDMLDPVRNKEGTS